MNDVQFHCFISALAVIYVGLKAWEMSMMIRYVETPE